MPIHELMLQRKLEGEPSTRYEMTVLAKTGRKLTLEVNSKLMLGGDGKPLGIHSIARDITDRKEAEARQTLLVRELQHRTKNMLAVVQSIATNTLQPQQTSRARRRRSSAGCTRWRGRRSSSLPEPGGRAAARARRGRARGLRGAGEDRGGPVVVGGAFAQMFALVVHELATNAAKYGSLSSRAAT